MFFFAIVGGTFAWLALSRVLDPTLPEAPNPSNYKTTSENDDIVGILENPDAAWTSLCGQGRRAFVGDVLSGLSRKDRSMALRILRGQLKYLSRKGSVAWAFLYFLWDAMPLSGPSTGEPRLASPLVCAGGVGVRGDDRPFLHGVGDAVEDWCTGDGWMLG